MLHDQYRQRVLTKLKTARNELEDALALTVSTPRYDPVVVPESVSQELSAMVDELNGILLQIEAIP